LSRSQNIPTTELLLLTSINISCITLYNVASVELLFLNPYCSLTSMLLVYMSLHNLDCISF